MSAGKPGGSRLRPPASREADKSASRLAKGMEDSGPGGAPWRIRARAGAPWRIRALYWSRRIRALQQPRRIRII